jgi:hypothetical protein
LLRTDSYGKLIHPREVLEKLSDETVEIVKKRY